MKRLNRLKPAQLDWPPGRDRWSIARILDHLNKVHALTLPKFEEALSGATSGGDERHEMIKARFMDRVFLKMMSPESPLKFPVPPIFEPDVKPNSAKIVKEFFTLHDAISKMIVRADEFRLGDIRVVSPVSKRLRPGFIAYLEANLLHEQYHWTQIEAILEDPRFPKS